MFLIAIPVSSKMMPATSRKNPDTYMVSEYELAHQTGSPEFMSLSSLGKYINRDAGKYQFRMEKIHKGLVIPQMSPKEQKESSSRGCYTRFSNFCKGKYILFILLRLLQDNTQYNFACNKMIRRNIYVVIVVM